MKFKPSYWPYPRRTIGALLWRRHDARFDGVVIMCPGAPGFYIYNRDGSMYAQTLRSYAAIKKAAELLPGIDVETVEWEPVTVA